MAAAPDVGDGDGAHSSSTSSTDFVRSSSYGGGANILSDKVNRALSIRTDTPAMKAALDALASLPANDDDDYTGGGDGTWKAGGGIIDARSVRAAIEKDALRHALEFQNELRRLANDATELRERVDNVVRVAKLVVESVNCSIIDTLVINDDDNPAAADSTADVGGGGISTSKTKDAWETERDLASRLAMAQRSYVEAVARQNAVNAFLDKFDLSPDEARLLDRYDFAGFVDSNDMYQNEDENGASAAFGYESIEDSTAFLNALERLAVIRKELTRTFGSGGGEDFIDEENNDTIVLDEKTASLGTHSALRMMEQLAARQERAHERLYGFLQRFLSIGIAAPTPSSTMVPTSSADAGRSASSFSAHDVGSGALGRFRDGDEMDEAYHHSLVRRSFHVLRHSPARRVHALELVASGRRTEVTRRFLLALTSGYGGMAPLEMKAHDPVSYVGDMLAFAFRAFRVEGDLVRTLLMWNDGDKDEGNNEENADESVDADENEDGSYNKPMNMIEMLAQSMSGLARPLRTRISQVVSSLASQPQPHTDDDRLERESRVTFEDEETSSMSLMRLISLFSVCGLLKFYRSAVRNALEKLLINDNQNVATLSSADNPFLVSCDDCLTEAADSFVASLRAFGAMLSTHMSASESEAKLAQKVIKRIAEERVASPGFSDELGVLGEDVVSKQLSLAVLVGTMIDAALPHLRSLDDCAALNSALSVAVKCGLNASELVKWGQLIQETEKDLVEALVNAEVEEVLHACGLGGLHSALQQHMSGVYVEGMTMSSHPGLSQRDLEVSMTKFYSSLFSPPIPTFEDTIKDPEVRKVARSKTAQRVVDVYRNLYEAITSERGGYADLAFMGHNPEQVRVLLSL